MSAFDTLNSGHQMPRIAKVEPADAERRLVEGTWIDGDRSGNTEIVDLSSLIDAHRFYALLRNDAALFGTVHVVDNGEAITWGDGSIDMSAVSIERLAAE